MTHVATIVANGESIRITSIDEEGLAFEIDQRILDLKSQLCLRLVVFGAVSAVILIGTLLLIPTVTGVDIAIILLFIWGAVSFNKMMPAIHEKVAWEVSKILRTNWTVEADQ